MLVHKVFSSSDQLLTMNKRTCWVNKGIYGSSGFISCSFHMHILISTSNALEKHLIHNINHIQNGLGNTGKTWSEFTNTIIPVIPLSANLSVFSFRFDSVPQMKCDNSLWLLMKNRMGTQTHWSEVYLKCYPVYRTFSRWKHVSIARHVWMIPMYVILICCTTWTAITNLLNSETSLLNVIAHLYTQFGYKIHTFPSLSPLTMPNFRCSCNEQEMLGYKSITFELFQDRSYPRNYPSDIIGRERKFFIKIQTCETQSLKISFLA